MPMLKHLIIAVTLWSIHGVLANNPPRFEISNPTENAREDVPIGTVLFNITASDQDGDALTFSTSGAATGELVKIGNAWPSNPNRYSAEVILIKELDRDHEPPIRPLLLTVADTNGATATTTIFFIIEDVNDEAPRFEEAGYRVTVKESAVNGTVICTVRATDPDMGSGGVVYYGLKAKGQGSETYEHTFEIDVSKGSVTVNEKLDYEERTFYQYNVTAWDNDEDPAAAGNHAVPVDLFVTIQDVQDTPPRFRNLPYIRSIHENVTIGASVLQVLAYDGDLGVPNELMYTLVAADNDSGSFDINPHNGTLTTAELLDADSADMKRKGGVLSFRVNASEVFDPSQEQLGETSTDTRVTITVLDINDNAPEFSHDVINASVLENTPVGVPLTLDNTVEVEDVDMAPKNNLFELYVEENGTNYYDFDTIPGKYQSVSRSNIMIRVNNTELLDFETRTSVTFQIVAKETDSSEQKSTTVDVFVKIINVNDNSPIFDSESYKFDIPENASINDILGQVNATDADSGTFGDVYYQMELADADFKISKLDGILTVAKPLDRETTSSYNLLVFAFDNDTMNSRRTGQTRVEVNITDVNDCHPEFDENILTIYLGEDTQVGTIVTTVTARDADEGVNAVVEYYIYDQGNADGRFAVNKTTGVVTVAASLEGIIDFRWITVEARDKGYPSLSSVQNLTFFIRGANLNEPNFTSPAGDYDATNPFIIEVEEEQPLRTEIYTLVAQDKDSGSNGKVSYKVEPGQDWDFFGVDFDSGSLYNAKTLDAESQQSYTLQVTAEDGGTPSFKTSLPIKVMLKDIDDNLPYFSKQDYPDLKYDILVEEEMIGCTSASVNVAEDKDVTEENRKMCYFIENGDQPNTTFISLNKTTGQICLTETFDRETKPFIDLTVRVSRDCSLNGSPDKDFDGDFPKLDESPLLHVKMNLIDINDHPPVFDDDGKLSTGILFDTPVGEIVYNLRDFVTDRDEGSNAVTYFRDNGQTGSDIADIGDGAFNVFPNGSVSTKRLFSSTMLGYVEISVVGNDTKYTAQATLKIYIISNVQRVKIIFNREPDEVRKIRAAFISELEQLTKFRIVVEKIASHELPDKSTVQGRTDMFIHALYNDTGEFVPASEIWRAFDFTPGIAPIFAKYGVTETRPVVSTDESDDTLTRNLTMGLILVALVLTLIAMSLAIALYCIRQKYVRRLRAERTADIYQEEKEPMPGMTNIYAASNPVFMKQMSTAPDDTSSIDLDDNAVGEGAPADVTDEQEVTININSPDALKTMSKGSVLDDVLRYSEMERSKLKGDKQTLIEENCSDGDSGTYTSIQGLEQTEI